MINTIRKREPRVIDPTELVFRTETPAADEYCNLRKIAGLSTKTIAAAERGLPNSLFATTVRHGRTMVAMGRVVGDGGCNFEIVDMAVHPDYQQQGLGTKVMASIMEYIEENALPSAYISIIADDHSPALYQKFGFRPTTPRSIGMSLRIED
jgi:ribosomal protein S18 acetylase RimI-like enzyme